MPDKGSGPFQIRPENETESVDLPEPRLGGTEWKGSSREATYASATWKSALAKL